MNVKLEEVLAARESAGILGKEAGEDPEKNAAVKVNGANGIKAAKSGGGTEFNRSVEDLAQSRTTQLNTVFPASNSAESSKMKDRIVQEIRYLFATQKDELRTQVQLRLEPEHLGQLTIKLFFNKGELSAHFYTGNSYVKDILEGSMQQLRDVLGQQDLKLNEALVFAGDGGSGGAGHYFGEKSGRGAPPYGGYSHRTYGDAQVESADSVLTKTDSSRVNYLI
jgi:flagellar hook-length control protein FliK